VAQYLNDIQMQNEELNRDENFEEIVEEESEDENKLTEQAGHRDQGTGESGNRRNESPGNKANRNYGKRKSESKAFGEVLDDGASPERHHNSVHAETLRYS